MNNVPGGNSGLTVTALKLSLAKYKRVFYRIITFSQIDQNLQILFDIYCSIVFLIVIRHVFFNLKRRQKLKSNSKSVISDE
jgi:hypothetical protein